MQLNYKTVGQLTIEKKIYTAFVPLIVNWLSVKNAKFY